MLPASTSKVYEKYKILSTLGNGGFSVVYKVQELNPPHEIFALKYFQIKGNSDKENTIKRFKQEIEIYKKINSNMVAKFIEAYTDDEEQFLVMEYVEGDNLTQHIAKNGKLIPRTAIKYAMQIAEGLGELHNSKIIHRDVKSSNIIVTKDRNIKLIDFGLSLGDDSQRLTQDAKIIGSLYYLAPELCMSNNTPTIQSDIYALGIMVYEMLTGQYPFKGANPEETIRKQKFSQMPDIMKYIDLQALANVIYKATNKLPEHRHQSMWEFREDIKTSASSERYYEKPYNAKKARAKKNIQDVINSKTFLYSCLIFLLLLLIIGVILLVALI